MPNCLYRPFAFQTLQRFISRAFLFRAGNEVYYGAPENSPLLYKSRCAGTIGDYSSVGLLLLALMEFNEVLSPRLLWW